ncbi:pilus assembly protein [Neisseria sp. Ec49-e6-T10]|uniref:pilus assembly protein n=1 Tax=Neisseria sp. Ec49-e6-T10 TaxID=3140744 RepID=UPI003EB7A6A0
MKKIAPPFKKKFLHNKNLYTLTLTCCLLAYSPSSISLTITENFFGKQTQGNWLLPRVGGGVQDNVACLTAGNGQNVGNATTPGSPPKCSGITDADGKGALRLTPASPTYRAGGVVSDFTFPTNEGLEVSFTTYTYGGSNNADGMTFFLVDGAVTPTLGASGGSLGYSCANNSSTKGEGISGGYLGIGIDEYGNFLNKSDNTSTPVSNPGRNIIALRGSGSINRATLNALYPGFYPNDSTGVTAINNTCSTGMIYNKSVNQGIPIDNYKYIAHAKLNSPINSTATVRSSAFPINYKLKITPDGLLSLWWSYNGGTYQPILVDKDIISTNGPLPGSFRFGFAGSTGAYTNIHEVTCFKAAPASKTVGSSSVSLPDAEFRTDSQIFSAFYNSNKWTGQVTAHTLYFQNDSFVVPTQATWDASCLLTGGECANTGQSNVTKQEPDDRTMWTYLTDSSEGTTFKWSSLTDTEKAYLNSGDNQGEARLSYLRGDRTAEISSSGGQFRARESVLADIVNASPAWIGPPSAKDNNRTWQDALYASETMTENIEGAEKYTAFQEKYNARLNVTYVGANDGFLHGFRSGAYDVTGKNFSPTTDRPNDGKEVLAYMPASILKRIHNASNNGLDFSNSQYGHNYYHDATPGVGDVFYGGKWHSILVSGLGVGGATIYALDVTDPDKFDDTKDSAKEQIIGEWSYNGSDPIWQYLGNTYGTPEIRRFHNGQWGAIFGNGWCLGNDVGNGNCSAPSSGKAGIYVMLLDQTTGEPSFHFLNTNNGSTSAPNGIAHVTSADLDEDQIVDYVYAGDLQGNVWRFDLTSKDTNDWKKGSNLAKLFTTPNNQPIFTKIAIQKDENLKKVILNFGTGVRKMGYLTGNDVYAANTQSLYGIWDWDMAAWNSKSAKKYDALTGVGTIAKSKLTEQKITTSTNALTNNKVCWANISSCTATPSYGWYMDLPSITQAGVNQYEQIVYSPKIYNDTLFVNTYIPNVDSTFSCDTFSSSGFTYGIRAATGGGIPGLFGSESSNLTGYRQSYNAKGEPIFIEHNGKKYMGYKDENGTWHFVEMHFTKSFMRRLSWRHIT